MRCPVALASVIGLLASSGVAVAAPEPDVVVSTVGSTLTKYGTTNGISGYAMTTVSCNIGSANAIWLPATADHPVIGQQMYRLKNNRFEQIGMSWLKHGFCAADAPSCTDLVPGSTYTPNGSCDWLGPFATDTYSAGLNGQQSNLGPRSEINAVTGDYPYPYVLGSNASGNCTYKRLQIANADMDPALNAGARYFAEVHYVTTDEALSSRRNNASYREVLVGSLSGSQANSGCTEQGYNLAFSGGTVPMKPAIEAWKTIDPTVVLVPYDIIGDGRIWIGAKVTDLGGGTWQYEYAVYNHNSDASICLFSIPKSSNPALVVSNLGFHDVPYHSGEPYDGTDWPGTVSAGSVSWNTAPFASNPNANAIRWSTMYNFRFQANRPPATGSVSLVLFKTDSPIAIAGLPVPSAPPACPADFNADGARTLQDLFDYLSAYFSGSASADFNNVGGVTIQDLLDYVGSYLGPCP